MAKKKTEEVIVTPTARAYINMVQDSINQMESSDEKLSANKKRYIEILKENIVLAPKWFTNMNSSKLVQMSSKEKK